MDGFIQIVSWRLNFQSIGDMQNAELLILVIMSFIGSGVVMRLTGVESSFNFSVNFSVMLLGCLAFHYIGAPILFPMHNDIIASVITANLGMTLAGLVLLLAYRTNNSS